ncbi:DUF5777 family beta-barrel protein [uncultured Polaribacter sp.]|uniref:DUF5777 family beta-barrel protein n=1 Tax=uncultured Polaribacter sp. TaxID=174711 RepID=UPI0026386344|nr:DUF5777 family beta-barrel protein [uncultured Polaribacter sp.]
MKTRHIFRILIVCLSMSANAQDLLEQLQKELPNTYQNELASFKSTRIGLGHSVETRQKGALQLSFYNRYWNKPTETEQSFLADEVTRRYGLDYAFTDKFTIGLGYTNFDKITDGHLKYRLFQQKKDAKKMPVSVTLVQNFSYKSLTEDPDDFYEEDATEKVGFCSQILISKKVNRLFSLQIAPTLIYRTAKSADPNDPATQFAVVFAGRHKIGKHTSIVSEYGYVTNPLKSKATFNTFMTGINWEIGDIMAQFHVTNARNYAEDVFLGKTTNNFNFKDPNFHFGLNVTYILHTRNKKIK